MKKKTILDFKKMKETGEKIAWLTAYDYPSAHALQAAEIDLILVGDSGIMCQYGEKDTLPATMRDQIMMTKAVKRGAPDTFIVGDMPFGSYEVSTETAVKNAIEMVKETGCDAIKFEGYRPTLVREMQKAGLVVFGHLGLTPQSATSVGGYRVQRDNEKIYEQIRDLGADFVLVEAVFDDFNYENDDVVVFGIGAGKNVDGQLLILHDILGYYPDFKPKFAKNYWLEADKSASMLQAVGTCAWTYKKEVKTGEFPSDEYCYKRKK